MTAPVCSACAESVAGPTTRGDGVVLCQPCRTAFYRSPQGQQAREVMFALARVWAAKVRGPRLQVVEVQP